MDFRVLGPLEVRDGERPVPLGGRRQQMVLAALLLRADEPVSADWLIDAVWGEAPPLTARKTLQAYVSRLRSVLGTRVLEAAPAGYVLHVKPGDVDAARFERMADEGRRLVRTEPTTAACVLREALDLWRGAPWGDFGHEPAFVADAERLRELRLATIEERIEAEVACGSSVHLIGELQGLVAQHPWRERLCGQLMLALYRSGRQAEALRAYRGLRRSLVEELGIDPSPELQTLRERILRQDADLAGTFVAPPSVQRGEVRNPFKGLLAFGESDAGDFFGRQALVEELRERVDRGGVVAVVGASGSGKSSVVRAGLLPTLEAADRDGWRIATMIPGVDPFAELLAALHDAAPERADELDLVFRGDDLDLLRALGTVVDGERFVLLVDQFEELFSMTEPATVRDRFIRNMIEAVEDPSSRLSLVLTLRADFFDRALDQPGLGGLLSEGMVTMVPLAPAELEAAAVEPARRAGVIVEPDLVAELVDDMSAQPGALPLFQFVLTELFEGRDDGRLTVEGYARLGGLTGSLDRRAEAIYGRLDAEERSAARQVFLRLVNVGEETDDTRRRASRRELEALDPDGEAVETVLGCFDRARLLSFDRDPAIAEPTVELAHEALLHRWARLRRWVVEARDDLRLERLLATEAREWRDADRDGDYLISGSRLDLYETWRDTTTLLLDEQEQEYLDASLDRRRRETADDASRRERQRRLERRAVRRLRWLVAAVSIAAVIGAALALFAASRSREAEASRREARSRELANAALVNLDRDPELSVLLALRAVEATRGDSGTIVHEAEQALHDAVGAHRSSIVLPGGTDVTFLASGHLLVGGETSSLVDPSDGSTVSDLGAYGGRALAVAATDDGGQIAIGSNIGMVAVWDLTAPDGSDAELRWTSSHPEAVSGLRFSPDGTVLASVSSGSHTIRVWDAGDGELVEEIAPPEADLWGVPGVLLRLVFDPTGDRLAATGFRDGTVRIYDLTRDEWAVTLSGHQPAAIGADFYADGTRIVTGAYDGTIKTWDTASGELLTSTDSQVGQVIGLDVSTDDSLVAVGGTSGLVEIWRLGADGPELSTSLPGHESTVAWVGFDATASRLATSGNLESVRIWQLDPMTGQEWASFEASTGAYAPDGETLVLGGPGRDVTIVDAETWSPDVVLHDVAPFVAAEDADSRTVAVAVAPDGTTVATASHAIGRGLGRVQLWDRATGRLRRTIEDGPDPQALTFSSDGALLAAAFCAGESPARVWDVNSAELVFEVPGTGCGRGLDIDPAGKLLSVQLGETVGNVQVWELDTGRRLPVDISHPPAFRGAAEFDPARGRLLTAGADGLVQIWDVDSGESLMRLEEHDGAAESAVWSPDGAWIATGDAGGTIRLWDAATGDIRLRLPGHAGFVLGLSFSPDGRRLISTDDRGNVRIWAIDPDDLIELASERLTRELTDAECDAYHFDECPNTP